MKPLLIAALLLLAVPVWAQPVVTGNPRFQPTQGQRERITALLVGLPTEDLPTDIVVLNQSDFQTIRLQAGRRYVPGGENGKALTLLNTNVRRTYLLADVLSKSDDELETVLLHEIAHIRRYNRKLSQDERFIVEDAQRMFNARRPQP